MPLSTPAESSLESLSPIQTRDQAKVSQGELMPPSHNSNSVILRARYAAFSTSLPPTIPKLNRLAEYFKVRPAADAESTIIIAVDGLDRNAVQLVIAELQDSITREFSCTVRVPSDFFQAQADEATDVANFHWQIQKWAAMWDTIIHSPPPLRFQTRYVVWMAGGGREASVMSSNSYTMRMDHADFTLDDNEQGIGRNRIERQLQLSRSLAVARWILGWSLEARHCCRYTGGCRYIFDPRSTLL